jgi:protoporphyrinogen oxidase
MTATLPPRVADGDGIGIVGGGLLGLGVAYALSRRGVPVSVYEATSRLGGLAGTAKLGGIDVDRFYHAVALTDDRVIELARELGLEDRIRWRRLGVGFFHDGRLASMSRPRELIAFPGLKAVDRVRLAAFGVRCRTISDHRQLDDEPVEAWARRVGGSRLWERLWRPLLDAKFDGRFDDLPATYLWSRMRRTTGTRDRSGREVMGWIRGGHQALADAIGDEIRRRGGAILTQAPVRSIVSENGRIVGVALDGGLRRHETVVSTLLRPQMENLLPADVRDALAPDPCRYLGVVCVVARVRKSVSPYYALNITDRSIPLTSVVETTHVVDPEHVGGHLLYVPKYVQPASEQLARPSEEIACDYLGQVQRMFPAFDPHRDVICHQVARATVAEPVHRVGVAGRLPELRLAPGLLSASAAHVYPDIVHAQAIIAVADRVAATLLDAPTAHVTERKAA